MHFYRIAGKWACLQVAGFLSLLLLPAVLKAQEPSFAVNTELNASSAISFAQHLITIKNYNECATYIDQLLMNDAMHFSSAQKDSLYFYQGFSFFRNIDMDSALLFWQKVPLRANEPISINTHFHSAAIYYKKQNWEAYHKELLQLKAEGLQGNDLELWKLYAACEAVMEQNPKKFDSLFVTINLDQFVLKQECTDIKIAANRLLHPKKRNGATAALLSTVIPGSGKLYAGYSGAALGAFITNAIIGGVAAENYFKSGLKSPNFIAAAGLFAIFYSGNIIGSLYSVKNKANENKKYYRSIMVFNMYGALERVYPE